MEFYQPLTRQASNSFFALVMRSTSNHDAILQLARQVVWEVDPKLPVVEAATMAARIGESIARPRFFLTLSSAFATTGVLLAAIGVYGVAAYWVSRRRRELAIRIAIGASSADVTTLVMRRGLRLAVAGGFVGLVLALAGARLIESMLFQTSGHDPVTLGIVTFALCVLALLACLGPALRAARVDPITTLRAE
jgi:ABC-type antimicrobial peptide transport system permease subunit